jgi:hypothetical protein
VKEREFTFGSDGVERRRAFAKVNLLGREERDRRCSTNSFHFRLERMEEERKKKCFSSIYKEGSVLSGKKRKGGVRVFWFLLKKKS